jgi:hypothetical protein
MKFQLIRCSILILALALAPLLIACDSEAETQNAPVAEEVGSVIPTDNNSAETGEQLPMESDVPPPSRDVFVDATCDYEAWIGQPLDEAKIKEEGRRYRILKPGDMMTMDLITDRINVEHEDGKVTRVWCG